MGTQRSLTSVFSTTDVGTVRGDWERGVMVEEGLDPRGPS